MTAATERTRLSRQAVVEAALALADDEGLDKLTIRRLAQHLGVTPMALYWHFKNKDELLSGVANLMWSKVDAAAVEARLPWLDQLRAIMESLVAVLRQHPSSAQLIMDAQPEDVDACFDVMEVALRALRTGGFSTVEAADVCRHGLRTATSLTIGQPGVGQPRSEAEEAALRRKRIAFQSLPPARYPYVIEAAEPFTDCDDPDAYYRFGIDLFIGGVRAMAERRSSGDLRSDD